MSVETYPDVDTLVSATGDRLAAAITAAITARGQALVDRLAIINNRVICRVALLVDREKFIAMLRTALTEN